MIVDAVEDVVRALLASPSSGDTTSLLSTVMDVNVYSVGTVRRLLGRKQYTPKATPSPTPSPKATLTPTPSPRAVAIKNDVDAVEDPVHEVAPRSPRNQDIAASNAIVLSLATNPAVLAREDQACLFKIATYLASLETDALADGLAAVLAACESSIRSACQSLVDPYVFHIPCALTDALWNAVVGGNERTVLVLARSPCVVDAALMLLSTSGNVDMLEYMLDTLMPLGPRLKDRDRDTIDRLTLRWRPPLPLGDRARYAVLSARESTVRALLDTAPRINGAFLAFLSAKVEALRAACACSSNSSNAVDEGTAANGAAAEAAARPVSSFPVSDDDNDDFEDDYTRAACSCHVAMMRVRRLMWMRRRASGRRPVASAAVAADVQSHAGAKRRRSTSGDVEGVLGDDGCGGGSSA